MRRANEQVRVVTGRKSHIVTVLPYGFLDDTRGSPRLNVAVCHVGRPGCRHRVM
jgi:hypothetical protein